MAKKTKKNVVKVKPLEVGDTKTTKAEMNRRIKVVIDLIQDNNNSREIVACLVNKFKVAESTIRKYITAANTILDLEYKRDLNEVRLAKLTALERDRDIAFSHFQNCTAEPSDAARWFKIYLDVKNKILEFYPDLIQSEEVKETNINLIYDPRRKLESVDAEYVEVENDEDE